MKINVCTLNSFAKTKDGGNPAGVVMNADSLSDEEMKKIAAVLGFSETAFVSQ
ncbi:PhzF family phenazine biosynthesis protein [Oscillibacter sp.]|uniref:PhzF family phenazine biosynthesis protein n=1 Tax=Oscillibacter sp. TaxID=1945593 RepID=UPI0037CB388D